MGRARPDKARNPRKARKRKEQFFATDNNGGHRRRISESEFRRREIEDLPRLAIGASLGLIGIGAAASAAGAIGGP